MKHFNRYITGNLLATLGMAMAILAFVMLSVHFFRAFSMLANGASPLLLGKIILYLIPDVLRYVLPLSLLVATVLVFSRMSADNEITAMKASGIGLWQIVAPGVALSALFCLLSLWLGLFISPELRYKSEQLRWQALSTTPLALIEPGTVTRINDTTNIRVGSRDENGLMRDIHYWELDEKRGILRDITAGSGLLDFDPEEGAVTLILRNFTFAENSLLPPGDERKNTGGTQEGFLSANSIAIPVHFAAMQDQKSLVRKNKMMPVQMLLGDLCYGYRHGLGMTKEWMELHHRLALAFSPLSFMLLGIPFGIRNRRSETSSGLLICIMMALVFYGFSLLSGCLVNQPALHPELIIWIPNLVYQIGGLCIIHRLSRT